MNFPDSAPKSSSANSIISNTLLACAAVLSHAPERRPHRASAPSPANHRLIDHIADPGTQLVDEDPLRRGHPRHIREAGDGSKIKKAVADVKLGVVRHRYRDAGHHCPGELVVHSRLAAVEIEEETIGAYLVRQTVAHRPSVGLPDPRPGDAGSRAKIRREAIPCAEIDIAIGQQVPAVNFGIQVTGAGILRGDNHLPQSVGRKAGNASYRRAG